ncbi:MAG: hypothetical protein Kow0037_07190 [Calditrichia bacterium]
MIRSGNWKVFFKIKDERRAIQILKAVEKEKSALERFFNISMDEPVSIYLPARRQDVSTLLGVVPPVWSGALFVPSKKAIVLQKPEWQQGFQDPMQSLRHEMVHLALHLRFGKQSLPVFFQEGLAEWLSGSSIGIQKGVLLANAILAKRVISFQEFPDLLQFPPARAHLAYVESLTIVEYLHNHYLKSDEAWMAFLQSVEKDGFEKALQEVSGLDLVDFEISWYRWMTGKYRWFVIFNLENLIWVAMVMVLAGAIYAVRYRNKKRLQEMADDELPFWDFDNEYD